ncbi:MAG: response regulator transcription factor [Akkermansiaceae bacterium]
MTPVIIQKEDPKSIKPLSRREIQVITLLAEGFSKQKISDSLCIKVSTVATHVKNIYRKMGVDNSAGAISKAYRCGILFLI